MIECWESQGCRSRSPSSGSLHIEDPEQVRRARMLIDHLLERALGPEDSIALIERIVAGRE
ncbi:Scr1 family TA system antitoxin-like transcriptional regulator [Actinosynnema sp. NPDC002837]